ncbi:MAG: two-component system sensor histidine kinase NtrB [Myxococcota bacterium]
MISRPLDSDGRPIPFDELPLPRAIRTGHPVPPEPMEIRFPDGSRRFIRAGARPYPEGADEPHCHVLTVEDRTEVEESTRRLRQSERLFRSVFDHTPTGILLADADGRIITMNDAYMRIIGMPPSMLTEAFRYNIGDLVPYKEAGIQPQFRGLLAGRPFSREVRMTTVAGKEVWVVYTGVPIFREGGVVDKLLVLLEDVAEQRMTEIRMRQMESMEATARLAGGMAHDINNTMTAVAGYVELLLARETDARKRRYLNQVAHAAGQVTQLVHSLSRLRSRSASPTECVDVADLVWHTAQGLARRTPPEVHVDVEVSSGPMEARTDRVQLADSLEQIFRNALDAMPHGGHLRVEVSAAKPTTALRRRFPSLPDEPCIRIAVSDTGVGIPKDTLHRVFEPYASTKAPSATKGLGLGLSLVYAYVAEAGGAIVVRSTEGEGTRVELTLPMAPPGDEPVAAAEPPSPTPES